MCMPTEPAARRTQLAARGQPPPERSRLDSPIAELLAAIEAEQDRAEHAGACRPRQRAAAAHSPAAASPQAADRDIDPCLRRPVAAMVKARTQAAPQQRRCAAAASAARAADARHASRSGQAVGNTRCTQPLSSRSVSPTRDLAAGDHLGIDAAIGVAEGLHQRAAGSAGRGCRCRGSTLVAAQRTMRLTTLSRAPPIASSRPSRSNSRQAGQPAT